MSKLAENSCEACRVGAPLATQDQIDEFLPQIPQWEIVTRDDINQLTRMFQFKNFVEAIDFTDKVGVIAEEEGHHPTILTEWGKVTVTWWSHKIRGLHFNDFVMAAKTDHLL